MSRIHDPEEFLSDLIAVFNKHHTAILWKIENMIFIREDAHIDSFGRREEDDVIIPLCSTVNWDKIIKLDGDLDE